MPDRRYAVGAGFAASAVGVDRPPVAAHGRSADRDRTHRIGLDLDGFRPVRAPRAGGPTLGLLAGGRFAAFKTVPLYRRRRVPNLVLVLIGGALAIKFLVGINGTIALVGLLVGMYSVAVCGGARRRVWALLVAGLFFVAGFVVFALTGNPRFIAISVPAVAHVAAWLIGDYLRTRRAYVAALEERAAASLAGSYSSAGTPLVSAGHAILVVVLYAAGFVIISSVLVKARDVV
jgi:hypothetical protein